MRPLDPEGLPLAQLKQTLLLAPGQEGYSALGIANGKLRYQGIVLTGYRQYLDLP